MLKLTEVEKNELSTELTIHRKVRASKRTGRHKGCSVKIGDAARVGDRFLAVCSVSKQRSIPPQWVIQFEEVGSWAVPDPGDEVTEMPWDELLDLLPARLTWNEEPGARTGDIFVFKWDESVWIDKAGGRHIKPFPAVFLEITTNPIRHPKGHWHANYEPVGFDKVEYMRPGYGITLNPLESLDPDAPIAQVEKSVDQSDVEDALREAHRDEVRAARSRRNKRRLGRAA